MSNVAIRRFPWTSVVDFYDSQLMDSFDMTGTMSVVVVVVVVVADDAYNWSCSSYCHHHHHW